MRWLNGMAADFFAYVANMPPALSLALIVIGLVIGGLFWWLMPKLQVRGLITVWEQKDRSALENSFRQTNTQALGGIVVLLGALIAYLNFNGQQNNVQKQLSAAHDQLTSNELSSGVDDLANKSDVVRIAGVYALAGIMAADPQYQTTVLEALCLFVRDATKQKTDGPPPTDVQAALTAIGKQTDSAGGVDLVGDGGFRTIDLSGAHLNRANLNGANLTWATLTNVDLSHADLRNAIFTYAIIGNSSLASARLIGANFHYATLQDVNMTAANISAAEFTSRLPKIHPVDAAGAGDANVDNTDLTSACGSGVLLPSYLNVVIPPCRSDTSGP